MPVEKYNYNKLASKHVLVIGGTSGIGFAVAKAALAASASVTISSSSADRVTSAIARLKEEFPSANAQGLLCDLAAAGDAMEENIRHLFSRISGGKVDHIVYTAADKLALMPVTDLTRDRIIAAGQLRFVAPLLVAKVGASYLTAGPESSITLTTGTVWEHPAADWTVVAGYMGGVCSIARNLALELKPVRVNAVSPGLVDTELWDAVVDATTKEGLLRHEAAKHPTGRVARAEDIAEAYMYLMKDCNITGRVISTDSGSLLV